MKPILNLVCTALLLGTNLASANAQGNNLADNPETRLPYSLFGQVYPPSLGEESIAIFRDIHQSGSAGYNRARYYVQPYFKPDFLQFSKSVEIACADKPGTEYVEVGLDIEISSRGVNREIVDLLNAELPNNEKIKLGQLQPYPYASLHVVAGARRANPSNPAWKIFRHPVSASDLQESSGFNSVTVSFRTQLNETPIPVSESCDRLSKIAKDRDISAYILTRFNRLSQNSINVNYTAFFQSQAYRDIFRDERSEGGILTTSKSSGAGLGLNIRGGFLGADASKSSTSSQDTRKRFVSADVINQAAAKFAESVRVEAVNENPERALSIDQIITKAEALVLQSATQVRAEFSKLEDGSYQVSVGNIARGLTANETKSLLEASSAPDTSASEKNKIVYNDATVEEEVDGAFKDNRGVKWEYEDGGWVPTSVDIFLIEDTNVTGSSAFDISDVGVVSAAGYQLIALTTILREGELPPPEPVFLAHEPYKSTIHLAEMPLTTQVYRYDKGSKILDSAAKVTCNSDVELPSGFVQIGGHERSILSADVILLVKMLTDTLHIPIFRNMYVDSDAHCLAKDFCTFTGSPTYQMVCVTKYREEGCYVSQNWLQWYEERERKLPHVVKSGDERRNEICSDEYLTK
jgi:hypothetical protein